MPNLALTSALDLADRIVELVGPATSRASVGEPTEVVMHFDPLGAARIEREWPAIHALAEGCRCRVEFVHEDTTTSRAVFNNAGRAPEFQTVTLTTATLTLTAQEN
jgi:hypothetical protein